MENLYHQTNKMMHEVQAGLSRLERATGSDILECENRIQETVEEVIGNCERLDVMVNKEPPTRRANAKLRVDQLKYDCQHFQAALRNIKHRRDMKDEEEKMREALLHRDFAPNESDTTLMIDAALQQNSRMHSSHREMDNLLSSGSSILTNMREQRVTLKGAHKKMLDVFNTLGLSNTVMRLIERRTYQDRFILFGGMILTCVIMLLVWRYLT